jgi:hypothetical protein
MNKFIDRMDSSVEEIKADYHLFVDIQMGKYLSSRNKSEFSTIEEAKMVMGRIVEAYNQKIASDHLRLDNLNQAAKASWFNSIEIDFSAIGGLASGEEDSLVSSRVTKNIPVINKETKEFISFYDDLLPFLPEGAIMYLMFAGPALEAYGFPFERLKKIIEGEEPTEIEEDLLLWAHDIVFGVVTAFHEKDRIKKEKFLAASVGLACEELDEKKALEVVTEIYANYEEDFSELKGKKQKLTTKTKKKKK